jgi:hypothetical protein
MILGFKLRCRVSGGDLVGLAVVKTVRGNSGEEGLDLIYSCLHAAHYLFGDEWAFASHKLKALRGGKALLNRMVIVNCAKASGRIPTLHEMAH